MSNALLSFISEAMILSSSELVLFSIAVLGYLMMNSFSSLRTTESKIDKVCDTRECTESECTTKEILRRFARGEYQGVLALWPAVVCTDWVPEAAAFAQIIESMQQVGMEVQVIADKVRQALKQNMGLRADTEGLCHLVEELRHRGCDCLLNALLSVFEDLQSVLGHQVLEVTARAAAGSHLANGNTEAAEAIIGRYSSLQSLLMPVTTGCVLQELPSFTGQRGHGLEDADAGSEQALVLHAQKCDPNQMAAQLLQGLTPGLAADVFAFVELNDVLNCAGLACRSLHTAIWREPDFWVGLGGPVFAESLPVAERPTSIVPMIRSFRRWVFGIDGDWSLHVEQLGSFGHSGDALRSILGYIQVLQVGDAELSDIWRLVRSAESAMQRADVQDNVLLEVASEVVTTCIKRQDIFGSVDIKDVRAAFAQMEKRAEQEKNADERNRWFFNDEAESDEQGVRDVAPAEDAGDLLSLSFLAVMDDLDHQ
jgi:hypothetical protein